MSELKLEDAQASLLGRDLSTARDGPQWSKAHKVTWAGLMLLSGTFTTLFAKALFTTTADGSAYCNFQDDDDKHCEFNKPWFTVLLMKVSMALCVPLYYGLGLGKDNPFAPRTTWVTVKAVAFPASLDLLNTVLGNIGLLYVNSSIYQMTRGSVVIFSAILSVKYLGRKLYSFHYSAIMMVIVAVILVGTAGIMQSDDDDSSSGGEVILGLGFIVLAQAVTAVQFIAEESLMNNRETTLDPVALVGLEGLWGCLMFVVLAPILTYTPASSESISIVWHEDFNDTFVQLSNSTGLCLLSLGYFVAILVYNVSANNVTQCLSAVVRSILEACRVMGVWISGLMLWYVFNIESMGEQWSVWSYMQLAGFGVLMYGTFSYKGLVKLPWVDPSEYELANEDGRSKSTVDERGRVNSHVGGTYDIVDQSLVDERR